MSKWTKFGAVVVAAAMVGACGDDDGGTGGGTQVEITATESAALLDAIFGVFSEVAFSGAAPGMSMSVAGLAEAINETVSCPQGGNVSVTGDVTETTTSASFDADFDYNDCGSEDFVINGGLGYAGDLSSTDTSISLQLDMDGTLNVETPSGNTGSCTIQLSYDLDIDFSGQGSGSGTVSGKICGESFSQSF